jgi:ribosome-associated protein YbcJ (S4-like RNA binding protein)
MAKRQQPKPYWHEHVVGGRTTKKGDDESIVHPMRQAAQKSAQINAKKSAKKGAPPATVSADDRVVKLKTTTALDGSGQPYITLVQFLKMHQLVDTGGMGKQVVRDGGILVNNSEELRPGRKLHNGDSVTVKGKKYAVKVLSHSNSGSIELP